MNKGEYGREENMAEYFNVYFLEKVYGGNLMSSHRQYMRQ